MRAGKALLVILGVMNVPFAVWVIVDPVPVIEFGGLTVASPVALTEVRAMYGGLIGGLGILSLIGAWREERTAAALWANAWAFSGIAVVRSLSCLASGLWGAQALFSLLEIAAGVTCFLMLTRVERETGSEHPSS